MRRSLSCVLAGAALLIMSSGAHAGWLFNIDVCQTYSQPQDNFEVCVKGKYTNPPDSIYPLPSGWTLQPASYSASRDETCFSFVGPGLPQQSSTEWPYHFGLVFNNADHVTPNSVYWTRGPVPSPKPGTSCNVYPANLPDGGATFVVSNPGESAVVLDDVRWQVFPEIQPLESMDRGEMPPDSLNPAPMPAGLILAPGEAFAFTIPVSPASASAVCFVTARFPADVLTEYRPCPLGTSIWTQETLRPSTAP
jgi:hypothetical protein